MGCPRKYLSLKKKEHSLGVTQKIADPLIAANGVKHGKLMFATTGGEIGLACHALDSEFIDA